MRIIELGKKYESMIYVIDEEKLIFKLHCTCGDFCNRKIKKSGDFSDIKYFEEPCKHLKPFVEALEKQGYKLKVPKENEGLTHCSESLRKQLLERANNMCETPGCGTIDFLTIHRKIRGNAGGKYNMENCVVLCSECHKMRHAGEFKKN